MKADFFIHYRFFLSELFKIYMLYLKIINLLVIIFILNPVFSQFNNKLYSKGIISDTTAKSPVFQKPERLTPYQIFTGDTIRHNDSGNQRVLLPGSDYYLFTPAQDSNYYRELKLNIPLTTRMRYNLKELASRMQVSKNVSRGTPLEIALKNLEMTPEMLKPSGAEIVQSQYNIIQSLSIPYIRTYNPYGGLVSFGQIAQFLGLAEDVSPEIKYTLDYTTDVEIVIYSMQAMVIAKLFHSEQSPGSYTFTWNGRDDMGKMLPHGDYVAEVRIGKERYVRKRILVP